VFGVGGRRILFRWQGERIQGPYFFRVYVAAKGGFSELSFGALSRSRLVRGVYCLTLNWIVSCSAT
jgi:hypothetical protein